jgi:hypothetical protein
VKKLLLAAILFAGCKQVIPQQKPQIFRLYNNTKWYYPDSKSTVTIPAGYYAIEGDSIVCIKKDSVVNILTVNKK